MMPGLADLEKLQFWPSRLKSQPTLTCRYQLITSGVTFSPQLLAISSLAVTPCSFATDAQSSLSSIWWGLPGRGPADSGRVGAFSWPGCSLSVMLASLRGRASHVNCGPPNPEVAVTGPCPQSVATSAAPS